MKEPYKSYANKFKPKVIKYLFIGESPPKTQEGQKLRYFYNYENEKDTNTLLSNISCIFLEKKFFKVDNKEEFLKELQKKGVFLLDATYEPINKKSKGERIEKIKKGYLLLKMNIFSLKLNPKLKIFLIHNNVIEAIGNLIRRDFVDFQIFDVGFPTHYNDERFKSRIKNRL